ncbi:MAG: hypothetical protein LUI02_03760 [Clostridiales bacterium]|nr:hypothetical protein [Clostridiales bacterium]
MAKNNRTTKKPKTSAGKQTTINRPENLDSQKVVWAFDNIDTDGPFAFDVRREDFEHALVLEKMIEYATMTWGDVKKQTHDGGKSKNHYLKDMSHEAEKRLEKKGLAALLSDCIFSFALDNLMRVVGYVDIDKNLFHVLWYDPRHEVCPSTKKHT